MLLNAKYDSLDAVNDSKYEWRIKVRVIRIWDSFSTKGEREFKGRNMLLLDDKHKRMHAFIWPSYIDELGNKIQEGKVYSIRNFSVKTYRKESLRCTRYDKHIWLSKYTKIVPLDDNQKQIRDMEFDFFEISDISDIIKQSDNNYLIDVIGVIREKDYLRHFVNQKEVEQRSFRFTLTDGSASIKVCLWDAMAESFSQDLDKVHGAPIVVILASCRHNEYRGEPYVSNVGATRYFINYNYRSVDQLKQRINSGNIQFEQVVMRNVPSTVIMTIAQIRTLDVSFIMTNVMCQVTVRTVKEAKDWNFDACSSCQEEVQTIAGRFRCEDCKRNIPFPEKRFRLCFIVDNATGAAAFVLSDREIEKMIGKSVYDVLFDQEKEGNTGKYPAILKSFESQQYTITICLTDDNVNKGSNIYFVIDIYKGFEITDNNNTDDDDFSPGLKSSQYSSTISASKNGFKTPDTEKSTSIKRRKSVNEEGIISITNLDEDIELIDDKYNNTEGCQKGKGLRIHARIFMFALQFA